MAEKKKKAAPPPPAKGAERPPRSGVKLLILGLIALLLLGGGGFAAYYFLWPKQTGSAEAGPEATGESQAAAQPTPSPHQAASPAPVQLIYHNLGSFTVNLTSGQARFLRVGLVVTTFNQAVPAALNKHMPRVRNDILTLLGSQEFTALNTPEGKEALRESLRQALVRILASAGEVADIRDVLFSDLIMQ